MGKMISYFPRISVFDVKPGRAGKVDGTVTIEHYGEDKIVDVRAKMAGLSVGGSRYSASPRPR